MYERVRELGHDKEWMTFAKNDSTRPDSTRLDSRGRMGRGNKIKYNKINMKQNIPSLLSHQRREEIIERIVAREYSIIL